MCCPLAGSCFVVLNIVPKPHINYNTHKDTRCSCLPNEVVDRGKSVHAPQQPEEWSESVHQSSLDLDKGGWATSKRIKTRSWRNASDSDVDRSCMCRLSRDSCSVCQNPGMFKKGVIKGMCFMCLWGFCLSCSGDRRVRLDQRLPFCSSSQKVKRLTRQNDLSVAKVRDR